MRCHIELKAIRNPGQSGIVGNRETLGIGNGELGNSGNTFRESLAIVGNREWAIGKRRQLGITGNWQSRESSGNPAIGESTGNSGNPAIRESGN